MANPNAVNFQRNVVRQTNSALAVALPAMLASAIGQSTLELGNVTRTLGQALKIRAVPHQRLLVTNQQIAEMAHGAVVRGWRSRLPAHTPAGGSTKHLSGALGPALGDPGNMAGTTDRVISFVDPDLLNREAPHWYRVNYGATGTRYSEGRAPGRFVSVLNGQTFASFTDDQRPDPISWLPKVFIMHDDGSLFPKHTEVERSESGARAARFFDLGHSQIARNGPRLHEKMWRDYLLEKGEEARKRLAKKDIHVKGELRFERNSWTGRVRRA